MKIKSLLLMLSAVCLLCACCDDGEKTATKQNETDTAAGTFTFSNISYDDGGKSVISALSGDTIKVVFSPKQEYMNLHFALSCPGLAQLNDSLFIVKGLRSGEHEIEVSATYERETDTQKVSYSAKSSFTVDVKDSYLTVPYVLQMSEDLLQFVTPELTYTDSEGKTRTTTLAYEDFTHSDSVTYSYTHNGVEAYHTYLPYAKYRFKQRYYSLPTTTEVTVKYIPKNNADLSRNDYEFAHGIDRESATGVIYRDDGVHLIMESYFSLSINIDISGSDTKTKDDYRQYIEKLSTSPDVRKLSIDENGHIEEEK